MSVKTGAAKMQTYYTVVFEEPNRKTGEMLKQVSSYVEDVEWFRARIEKRGGKIYSVEGPRQVETIPVYL